MNGTKLKGRLDRIGKTPLEHFRDIKELEVADGPEVTVKDIVPYKCEQVETTLIKAEKEHKALEIIKEKYVNIKLLKASSTVEQYNNELIRVLGRRFAEREFLTEEEFDLLKEVLE